MASAAERAFLEAFVIRQRRDRYLAMLESTRGREKFVAGLGHFRHFDPRFMVSIPPRDQTAEGIHRLLLKHGAVETCVVISENETLEGRELPLDEALDEVVGRLLATVLVTGPGPIAYYESEEPGHRVILKRA